MDDVIIADIATERGLIGGPFGSSLVGTDYAESGIPVIRGANMDGPVVKGDFVFVTPEKVVADLSKNIAIPGDLVFTQRGTLGQVAMVPSGEFEEYVISQSQMRLRVDQSVADSRFVYFACTAPAFTKQIHENTISTGVPHINLGILARLTIPRLGLEEQRAIAEVLGVLDDKIAVNDHLIQVTRELLSAHFSSLRIDIDVNESEGIPLSELIDLNPRLPWPTADEPAYLDMKNLPDHAMTASNWSYRAARGGARFQNGDTLLARITPCLENGKTGFVDFLSDNDIGIGSTEYIVMRARNGIPPELPYFLATSARFREYAIRRMVGTSGRQRISAADISNFRLGRPDSHALSDFARISELLMRRVKTAVDESRALRSARDELLPVLLSGNVHVRDAKKIVKEARR